MQLQAKVDVSNRRSGHMTVYKIKARSLHQVACARELVRGMESDVAKAVERALSWSYPDLLERLALMA